MLNGVWSWDAVPNRDPPGIPPLVANILGVILAAAFVSVPISAITLILQAKAHLVFVGIGFLLGSVPVLTLAMVPSCLLGSASQFAAARERWGSALVLAFLEIAYKFVLIIVSVWAVFGFLTDCPSANPGWAATMWAYGVAAAPWIFFDSYDEPTLEGNSLMFAFHASLITCCAVSILWGSTALGLLMYSIGMLFEMALFFYCLMQEYILTRLGGDEA